MSAVIENGNVTRVEKLLENGGKLTVYCSRCGHTAEDVSLFIKTVEVEEWVFKEWGEGNKALFRFRKGVDTYGTDDPVEAQCSNCGLIWVVDYDVHDFDLI